MDRRVYIAFLAAIATALALYFIALLMAPLVEPVAWAVIIGIATYPHYKRIEGRYPGHPDRSAGLMVAIVTICIILPAAGILIAIAQNAADFYYQSEQFFRSIGQTGTSALNRFAFARKLISYGDRFGIDISGHAAEVASTVSKYMVTAATGAVKSVAQFLVTLVLAIFVLYFVYRDGGKLVNTAVKTFPGDRSIFSHYISEIRGATTAVVIGTIFTCLAQGLFAGIGYFFAGVPAPILLGILTAIAALVPVVGTAIIWVPVALYIAVTGAYLKAILLAVWCILFVGIADNFVRALTIGATSNIPTLAIIFGAIGGAAVMGLSGLIVGPIVFAIVVVIWKDITARTGTDPDQAPEAGVEG